MPELQEGRDYTGDPANPTQVLTHEGAQVYGFIGRSLSVSGVARQRDLWFFAVGWAWWSELGSRWSGRSAARTTTLTPARATTG
jgi:hypothetical protein